MNMPAHVQIAQPADRYHQPLPAWITTTTTFDRYPPMRRAILQAIADACDTPAPGRSLVGALGGAHLVRRIGCSRATFWRHLRRLVSDGFIVPLGLGGNLGGTNCANEYGIPASLGALDDRRIDRRMRHMVRNAGGRLQPVDIPIGGQASFLPSAGCEYPNTLTQEGRETASQNETGGSLKMRRPASQNETPPYGYGMGDKTHGCGARRSRGRGKKNSQLRHIETADLEDIARLLAVYGDAVAKGLVADSEDGRILFVANAEYARRCGECPPALFATRINMGWRFPPTIGDEERARARLLKHDHGCPVKRTRPRDLAAELYEGTP